MTEQIIDTVETIENINENVEINLITIDQAIEDFSKIDVKQYLPSIVKISIINKILDFCIIENENGLKRVNYSWLEIFKTVFIISNYTNIDIDNFKVEELFGIYDQFQENGIYNYVIDKICKKEIEFIDNILKKEIEQVLTIDNGIGSILAKTLNRIVEKLPDEKGIKSLLKDLPKQINKINPEKLKYVSEAIGWNNGVKKEG